MQALVEPRRRLVGGQVIHCEGGARCSANSFFQITDVDSGAVRTVNPNLVTGIVRKGHGELPLAASATAHAGADTDVKATPLDHREVELGVVGRAS